MNKRLEHLYKMIPAEGRGIIDVGTDHGIIPIQLASSNYTGNIIASDIAPGPLKAAREAAQNSLVSDLIQFLLCDGLDLCPKDKIDCILIGGMGGDTICGILDRADWIFSGEYLLLLQPMTKAEVLRYWLVHNEFEIEEEAVVCDDHFFYQMFSAKMGKSSSMCDAEYLIGSLTAKRTGDSVLLAAKQQIKHIEKRLNGLQAAKRTDCPEYLFFEEIKHQLDEIIKAYGV